MKPFDAMRPHPLIVLALAGAVLGFMFASVSTFDFAQHLDRQVHGLHCSFIPGLSAAASTGSGCEVTLMSSYSSVLRDTVWGGIPIALPAMGVFAFFLFFGLDIVFGGRQLDKRSTGFYFLGSLVPAATSMVMAYISLTELDAACKLCIGIYGSSALLFVGSLGMWIRALRTPGRISAFDVDASSDEPAWADGSVEESVEVDEPWAAPRHKLPRTQQASYPFLIGAFCIGLVFVAIPVFAYVAAAPDHGSFIGECGKLDTPPDPELLIPVGPQTGTPAIEVFDPLCPACRGFEKSLAETRFNDELARKAVLFPLDNECNWMLNDAVHPGACAVSEAVICAEGRADEVIEWAFDHQEEILAAAKSDSGAARRMVGEKFPNLKSCVGSPRAKQKLNRSLRWAVDAQLRVLTPQLYINGDRLCDEDVDLGLEFALSRMLERR